jgi:hypothetical protein
LFPMGLALGALGLGVWIPYWLWPGVFAYPGQGHATLLIQGFMLCFIFGFLGTMMPKVLGVAPLGPRQFAIFPLGLAALSLSALAGYPRVAQGFHLLLLINFAVFIARRWKSRAGSPPPPFVFIALAMAADLVGTCLRLHALSGHLGPSFLRASSLLQYQAFPLLLILGVGGFLLPKLFANAVVDPRSLRAPAGGIPIGLLAMGLLFIGSYVLEAFGPALLGASPAVRLAHAVRAGVWTWFLVARVRIHTVVFPQPAWLEGARLSLYAIAAGMVLPVLWPAWLLAWEHVVFLGGFVWLTLTIAARVTAAHGGRLELLERGRRPAVAYGSILLLALAVRVATDLFIETRWMHLAVAAALGIAAIGVWSWRYAPLFFRRPGRP